MRTTARSAGAPPPGARMFSATPSAGSGAKRPGVEEGFASLQHRRAARGGRARGRLFSVLRCDGGQDEDLRLGRRLALTLAPRHGPHAARREQGEREH
jgi:hypothetical protein